MHSAEGCKRDIAAGQRLPLSDGRASIDAMDGEITFRSDEVLTPEEFVAWLEERPANDVNRYELIQGRIVMTPPAGFGHGKLDAWLSHKLWEHVVENDLGVVLGSSTGYRLPSVDVLEPDVSFVSKERLAAAGAQDEASFARVVPDLVIEVLSPSTARRDRTEKKDIYAANGVREYWLVDPRRRDVTVFNLAGGGYDPGRVVARGMIASQVLPGLHLAAEELFR